ncbi:MAG: glycosyltransferase family 2 protein [Acidobacteria bacterium]|nr:glycosyltransferase family 2 protein [Acidobacteriota bacterium]
MTDIEPDPADVEPSVERIVIAVVPRDRFSMFPRCLDALYAHTTLPVRLVVVAGDVDRVTERYLRGLQATTGNMSLLLGDHLLTQAEARNLALRQITERFCVVLENDTIVHENWLPPLLKCMRDEGAAVVTPLILWYRGIHAAGCMFDGPGKDDGTIFRHRILYTEIWRKQIDYPENHCVLLDRHLLQGELFDEVEPFDVDLGLTLRKRGLTAFLEPRSVVTYSAPPPWQVCDIPAFKFRWDAARWETRNREFGRKWGVTYDPLRKLASYRRQHLKLGLARWYPSKVSVALANVIGNLANKLSTRVLEARRHPR